MLEGKENIVCRRGTSIVRAPVILIPYGSLLDFLWEKKGYGY
jgi:hypothetical protein